MERYQQRIKRTKEIIRQRDLNYVLVPPSTNLRYLTGYAGESHERFFLLILPALGEPFFIAPELYRSHLEKTPVDEAVFWQDEDNPLELLEQKLESKGLLEAEIGVTDEITASFLLPLQEKLQESDFKLNSDIFAELRMKKDEQERELLIKASQLTDKVLEKVITNNDWVGRAEQELAAALDFELKQAGMEDLSFKPIVGVGPNGASPHHVTGEDKIEEGEAIVIDFGGVYHGYCSDMTRTICFGEPSDKLKKVYQIVLKAQQLAEEYIQPGVTAEEVDQVARDYITEQGYGDYFIHRTGHGIGMDCHESPYIVQGNDKVLEPGMAFSVEPGIYLPGEFGVRIEDLVIVTDSGCQILNSYPKEI
ncbi:M24 family metallopeptidase [Sporohalobacter salinus]|uniref:M24 family metallopeptidase n=1 Tax=Sporohalobacter salinus TaxID=1494606 RepID=UPI00195FFDB0|nr:Xaa-Pro peptidase family protein [Sporohalobacter salinus]MBM7624608.1 Xaa-Pro aminopeptidase [Sporohalobacter salinus]